MLYYNSVVYEESSTGAWSLFSGGVFVAAPADPRLPPATPSPTPTPAPTPHPTPTPSPTPSPTPVAPTTSASGTTVPSATQILDSSLNVWTISASKTALKNGVGAGVTANVALLLYFQGFVYHENASSQWYGWNGSGWAEMSGDPRTTTTISASGTTIPSASRIVDAGLNAWTLTSGQLFIDGTYVPATKNVILLLYYNGLIYEENSSNLWWVWSYTQSAFLESKDPRL